MAKLISGKEVSAQIRQKIKEEAQALRENSRSFAIPFDRQQLADYLCIERSAMSAELSRLQKDGLLQTERCHFCLIAPIPGALSR